MRNAKKLIGAVALAGALAGGGTAFTAGKTTPASEAVKGYGSQTITGVTAESISHDTNVPGDTIESVGLVLTGDTTGKAIKIAFSDAAPATCSDAGLYASATDDTTYSCTVSQAVAGATKSSWRAEGECQINGVTGLAGPDEL